MKISELIETLDYFFCEQGDLEVEINARITVGKKEVWSKIPCTHVYVCGGKKAVIIDALE